MSTYTITKTIYRDDDETQIEIEAEGTFEDGDLVSVKVLDDEEIKGLVLTQKENEEIREALYDERESDWDENKWQSERESA